MNTQIKKITPESLEMAKNLLLEGQVVAFPTETVYGLGAYAYSQEGIARIYEAKGRPSDNPLIVHIAPNFDLLQIAREVPEGAKALMERFWPGPMTIIMPKNRETIADTVTGGLDTVAIRMPSDPSAMALLSYTGMPIVAPSANTSGRPSPTSAMHVYEDMQGKIPLILDGGSCQVGVESTIVDLTDEKPLVLRPGGITLEMLREVIPEIDLDPAVKQVRSVDASVVPKAPGMKYRHYAPKGYLILTQETPEEVARDLEEDLQTISGDKLGVIATDEFWQEMLKAAPQLEGQVAMISLGSRRDDMETVAKRLFAALRQADELTLSRFYGEAFSREGVGEAVMNRFRKASSEWRER